MLMLHIHSPWVRVWLMGPIEKTGVLRRGEYICGVEFF